MQACFSQYLWIATILGNDGYRYCVSIKGNETETEILQAAEKFYGKPMDRVLETH